MQIFSGCVCHIEQLHAHSPFLFPIVFSIDNIFIQDCRKVKKKKLLIKSYVPAKREGKRQNKRSVVLLTHMSRLLKFQELSQLRLEFRKSV